MTRSDCTRPGPAAAACDPDAARVADCEELPLTEAERTDVANAVVGGLEVVVVISESVDGAMLLVVDPETCTVVDARELG